MKKLALKIEYDGSGYAGWQVQPNAVTVQGSIERALKSITGDELNVIGAGRTDAGVHAAGQAAHVNLNNDFPASREKAAIALNANLPRDIRILEAKLLEKDFHARFDASAREYVYNVISRESVFLTHFAAYFKFPFDPQSLAESASVFLGKHDFTAFSKHNPDTKSHICNVDICKWQQTGDFQWQLRIRADRFVYGMVRALVGAMYDCARGKRTIDDLRTSLQLREREYTSPQAPAHGLILDKIYYPPEIDPFD